MSQTVTSHVNPAALDLDITTWGTAARPRAYHTQAEAPSSQSGELSYRDGPVDLPLFHGTIPDHFASVVAVWGNRPAVVARSPIAATSKDTPHETTLTYTELDKLSNRVANSLAQYGIRKGIRVGVSLGNTAEYTILTYALFKLGAVLVPFNPGFTASQVVSGLQHLGAEMLIIGAVTDLAYKAGKGRSNEDLLRGVLGDLDNSTIQSEAVPSLRVAIVLDNRPDHPDVQFDIERFPCLTPYTNLLNGSPAPVRPSSPLDPSDTINIQFTSGTTSAPKAAMLSHHSILNNGRFIAHRMGLAANDKIVVPPPLFHCFGSVLGFLATATTGASILFSSPAFDPVATVRMCVDHQATGLYGVTTMFVAYLEAIERGAAGTPTTLRKGIVAGSSVPSSLMEKIQSGFGLEDLVICYGMTETSPVSCMTRPNDPLEQRTSSVGTPMPHTRIKIVSSTDRSVIMPIGERGELAASGYLTMKGYFNDPAKTSEVRKDEDGTIWVYSGDEAVMDKEGFVQITGRIKDLIIRGGENIHPLEVENCLFKMPGVQEASVVGISDDRLGECVAAFVIPHAGWTTIDGDDGAPGDRDARTISRADVRAWVKEKLSGHLVPKHVFWTDEYPKTASGKIQKFKLRDFAEKKLEEGS
ncbi:unnamed protein product [Clonostachys chloroleuca]|uniref:Uncharacterized protein n=1 Tax=Clonostachys chloroleuca TaxID=1926264 RepID=A0AA35MGH0_9HYPO|nr:unnamed protein product [Clonostachys chloroleuca]